MKGVYQHCGKRHLHRYAAEFEFRFSNRLVDLDPETLTDLQRAARFLYLQRLALAGKVSGKNFGVAVERPARFNLTTLEPDLEALHSRLSGVTVMCLDFTDFIRRVDRPETLFYLDPPYWGSEGDYGKQLFIQDRFDELAAVLGGVKWAFHPAFKRRSRGARNVQKLPVSGGEDDLHHRVRGRAARTGRGADIEL